MKKNIKEKLLLKIDKNNFLKKMMIFFRKLFYRNVNDVSALDLKNNVSNSIYESSKKAFIQEIKKVENEETRLLKLQRQYRNGEILEEEFSEEEIN